MDGSIPAEEKGRSTGLSVVKGIGAFRFGGSPDGLCGDGVTQDLFHESPYSDVDQTKFQTLSVV